MAKEYALIKRFKTGHDVAYWILGLKNQYGEYDTIVDSFNENWVRAYMEEHRIKKYKLIEKCID